MCVSLSLCHQCFEFLEDTVAFGSQGLEPSLSELPPACAYIAREWSIVVAQANASAVVQVAGMDHLRDEGLACAAKLEAAG